MTFKKICMLSLLAYFGSQVNASSNSTCSKYAPCYYEALGCNGGQNCFALNCDPQKSYPHSCYPKPLCVSFTDHFTQDDLAEASKFNGDPYSSTKWMSLWLPNHAAIEDDQLVLSMSLDSDKKNQYGHLQGFGATVASVRWIQYGNVTARVKTASVSPGVVTSFIIKNPQGDEIDFEWVGGSPDQVQTNYYYDGILDYHNQKSFSVGADSASEFHEYMIQWEEDFIKWHVNKQVVRTLYKKDTWDDKLKVYKFPSELAPVQLSIWDGGALSKYTSEWAGGPTNWNNTNTVYKAYFDYIDIQCKYNGNQTVPWVTPTIPTPMTSTVSTISSTTSSKASSTSSATSSATSDSSSTHSSSKTSDSASTKDKSDSMPTTHNSVNSASNTQLSTALLGAVFFLSSYLMN